MPPIAGGLRVTFPVELPISARVPDIAEAIRNHPVLIVAGALLLRQDPLSKRS